MNVQRAYASVADLYISLFGAPDKVHPDDLAFLARHLGGLPGPVLDAGCGPGHLTAYLRALGADVSGIDVVDEFIAHARAADPAGAYRLASLETLDVPDASLAGLLAWYSLIHLPPNRLDDVLTGFRRAILPGGTLVAGIFVGEEVAAFDHKVLTAYRWPLDEFSARLRRAGFTEIERLERPSDGTHRPHAAIAAKVAHPGT